MYETNAGRGKTALSQGKQEQRKANLVVVKGAMGGRKNNYAAENVCKQCRQTESVWVETLGYTEKTLAEAMGPCSKKMKRGEFMGRDKGEKK